MFNKKIGFSLFFSIWMPSFSQPTQPSCAQLPILRYKKVNLKQWEVEVNKGVKTQQNLDQWQTILVVSPP